MSLIPFGFWAASGSEAVTYWLATLGGASTDIAQGAAIDRDNNVYSFGKTSSSGAGGNDFLLSKFDAFGSIQWQRTLGGASLEDGFSVATDSGKNAYAFGYTTSTGAGGNDMLLAKYNSAGTIQWQRVLGGSDDDKGFAVAIDSADNIYIAGHTFSDATNNDFLLAKYNSSGTIQWQRTLGGEPSDFGRSVTIDSSDNVYIFGYTLSAGAGSDDFLLAKYNSSGTIQWQRVLGSASSQRGFSAATDSSNNIYLVGQAEGVGVWDIQLAKYDSAGSLVWQRVLSGLGSEDLGKSVAVDSSDNVYIFGNTNSIGAGSADFIMAKYNSSGTLQWQRVLGGTGAEAGYSIAIGSQDAIVVCGFTTTTGEGSTDFLIAKLPSDGSLTGTYVLDGVDIVYAAATLTAETSTLTAATSTLTAATSTLTASTSSLTGATSTLTEHFVEITA